MQVCSATSTCTTILSFAGIVQIPLQAYEVDSAYWSPYGLPPSLDDQHATKTTPTAQSHQVIWDVEPEPVEPLFFGSSDIY